MGDFSWSVALLIFTAYCFADWLFTIYTVSIVSRRKLLAANVGVGIYIMGAFGVVNYVADWRYIIPMCVGGWVGTYVSVWHEAVKDKRNATENTTDGC